MATKVCTKCKKEKDIDLFVVVSRYPDGHGASCKECHNQHNSSKYYENIDANRAKARDTSKRHYHKDEEKSRTHAKQYRLDNPEQFRETDRRYRNTHKEQVRANRRKYAHDHPDKKKKWDKTYVLKNKDKLNEKNRICRNSSPQNKIKHNLRNRIRIVLKGLRKGGHLPELIGCSVDFLKKHLESNFCESMSWQNYGKGGWEIDHILPCEAFDLNLMDHQLACFNWRNLQPLYKIPNIQKGAKYKKEDFDAYMDWFVKNVIDKENKNV